MLLVIDVEDEAMEPQIIDEDLSLPESKSILDEVDVVDASNNSLLSTTAIEE